MTERQRVKEGIRARALAERGVSPHPLDNEERFRVLVMASAEVLYRMSADWSEMVQLTSRGFLATTQVPDPLWLDRYVHPEDQPQVLAAIQEAIETKSLFQLEHRVKQADGSWGWMVTRAVPILDGDGEIIEWFGAAGDVTARHRQHDELLRINRQQNEFLARLSHELRNPLAAIETSVDLLQSSQGNDAEPVYRVLHRQVGHVTRLVDDLLDLSRITLDRVPLRPEPLDLMDLVDDVLRMTQHLITQRHQRLEVKTPTCPIALTVDRVRVVQILTNLIVNASKYSDDGGQIILEAWVDQTSIGFAVRDAGMGISADALSHIFEPYVSWPSGDGQTTGGLGLGLTVARHLATLHGGTVQAHSDGPGFGSEFVVRLPKGPSEHAIASERAQVFPMVPSCRRVLIVDDHCDLANVLGEMLERMGTTVKVAHNGRDGLAMLPAFQPTHVFLDLGMQPMSGYDVARAIRARPDFGEVVLVALTGWGADEDIRRSRSAGFQHHLVKPVNGAAMAAVLA